MSEVDPMALTKVTQQIFEQAVFLFAEPAEEVPAWPGRVLEARLSFAGPKAGEITIRASADLSAEVAANLLGLEPGDEEAISDGAAALAELLNMVAGALMKEWFGTKVICQLGIPAVADARGPVLTGAICATLVADEKHRIDVAATFQ